MRVLILGDGLLGSELKKQNPDWVVLSRKNGGLDINTFNWIPTIKDYDVVINCIAYTNTYDKERDNHWDINYKWVHNLIIGCNQLRTKLVHISSDYVYANSDSNASEETVPVHHNSWYAYTKLLSDGLVQLMSSNYLLIRCGFKPNPFPYDKAPSIVIGNFTYLDRVANMISEMVLDGRKGLYNVGGDTKSMYTLALETNPDVKPILEVPVKGMPTDVSMNLTKFNEG